MEKSERPDPTGREEADIVIISAYGRGNWMASELSGRGWKVTLVDVSEQLGPWDPEDSEGPFGLFEAADLQPSQKSRLEDEGETVPAPSGFTVWLKDGPIECRSELTPFQLRHKGIPQDVETYLRHPGLPGKEAERERKQLLKRPFRETWLAHLAHQIASPIIDENHRALESGNPSPIFTAFSIRQATADGFQKGLKAVHASGVKVRARSKVKDIRLEGRLVDALEIEDERSGVERGRSFVWMLSSAETARFSALVHEKLFPRGPIEADWFWARFRVELQIEHDDEIPTHAALIEDVFLPWTHANLLVLKKRAEAKSIDLWMRLPIAVRSDLAYLDRLKADVERIVAERLPLSQPKVKRMPQEAARELTKLGPPRIPVFKKETLAKLQTLKAPNLFFAGPEQSHFLDWLGCYRAQNEVVVKLEKLRAQWLAAEAKRQGSVSP